MGSVDLLLVSVVLLVAFSLGPILVLRRPEAWLLGLLLLNVVDPGVIVRLMSGRRFLVSSAVVPLVSLMWPRLEGPRGGVFGLFVACGAAASWIHGAYYLLALPVLALLGAGRLPGSGPALPQRREAPTSPAPAPSGAAAPPPAGDEP